MWNYFVTFHYAHFSRLKELKDKGNVNVNTNFTFMHVLWINKSKGYQNMLSFSVEWINNLIGSRHVSKRKKNWKCIWKADVNDRWVRSDRFRPNSTREPEVNFIRPFCICLIWMNLGTTDTWRHECTFSFTLWVFWHIMINRYMWHFCFTGTTICKIYSHSFILRPT
jgi:hypothetical protein